MALAKTFTPETPSRLGLDPTYTTGTGAANLGTVGTDHQELVNGRKAVLLVLNQSASAITVTVRAQQYVDGDSTTGLAVPNPAAISVPALASGIAGQRVIGPFDPTVFNNDAGNVEFTLSAHTDVRVAAIWLP